MRAIMLTKKKIRRIVTVAALAAAAAAVGITVAVTSVGGKAAARQLPIYRVERGDKKVALTFDVAWENSNTEELIDILDEYDARATFFITGDWCDRYPDDVRAFHNAGHEIGNHSDAHPHVEGINVNDLINDTREASRKISVLTGEEPTLYRAPYGEYDDSLITTIEGMGMNVIQWDVDSIDWKEPTPEEIKERVLKKTQSGSILLFHNDLENTTEALPQILTELKDEGYEFVPVGELIYREDYTIDANGEQSPVSKSSIELSEKDIEEVMAKYSDELSAYGITEAQLAEAAAMLKGGGSSDLPEEALAVIAQLTTGAGTTEENSGSLPATPEPPDTPDSANTAVPAAPNAPNAPDEATEDIPDEDFTEETIESGKTDETNEVHLESIPAK